MESVLRHPLRKDQAALWSLGQAGYVIRDARRTVVIDPYLTDSVGAVSPDFSRLAPPPLQPEELQADVYIVTHDHLDHLDPETVKRYPHRKTTTFVAPRLACRKLATLGVPRKNIVRIDSGEEAVIRGVAVRGVYAVPTEPDAIDTCGYRIEFSNGRSVYHSADTACSELLLDAAPKAELLLVCINAKWGNLNAGEAARLTARVAPKFAIPNHYDLMALNSENPQTFACFVREADPSVQVKILRVMEHFIW